MISYLKNRNFTKSIFILGMPPLKEAFANAGFHVVKNDNNPPVKSLKEFGENTIADDKIGAVIAEIDLNVDFVNLQKAVALIKKPEVIFLAGPRDMVIPLGLDRVMLGPGNYLRILEEATGRTGLQMAKPSLNLRDYIIEKLKIKDAARVLFIGDS